MIKFSHSIFALPFALAAMVVAADGLPSIRTILLIVCCMVTGRNAAMAYNRWLDADIDAENPRTKIRHIPQGLLTKNFVLMFTFINSALFIFFSYLINPLCFWGSFPTLALFFAYSWMKRFSALCHLILGLALGIAPLGAWVAVRGDLNIIPFFLTVGVLFWVAGFDLIYATQDFEFDRERGLHSIVVKLGISKSLLLSKTFHLLAFAAFIGFGKMAHLGSLYFIGLVVIAMAFLYEHSLVKPSDLSKINAAFFTLNGLISLLFFLFTFLAL